MEIESVTGEVLFDRSGKNVTDSELTHSDIWDDSLLIQHYDETMKKARNILASKLSSASSVTDSDCSNSHRTELVNGFSHNKMYSCTGVNKKKKKKKSRKKNEWHTGDQCRAQYAEDEEIYEATIVSMNNATGMCTVRFLGYNNQEDVAQSSLLKSKGKGARDKQMKEVTETFDKSDESTEESYNTESDVPSESRRQYSKYSRSSNSTMQPPQMPPPQMSFRGLPERHTSDDHIPHLPNMPPPPALGLVDGPDPLSAEALHTMLMSWYMTGYHTGYYQGLNHGKNYTTSRNKQASTSHNRNK